ncbi:GrxA family glutaredoxin [Candidatus Providencia siddallii]|uniref:Glutaredoxin 1 n=1 Tax=Candidatus Providencia siddallii TaxID=1715285 RepID=A0ABP1CFL2_9GAMM
MYAVIFGSNNCKYCIFAKELSEKIKSINSGFDYKFIDIYSEGITEEELFKIVGKKIETIPQIFIDKKYIGGFTEFKTYIKKTINKKDIKLS